MRIISGKFGGRRLNAFKAGHIRPTTDRVKESIFNRIRDHIDGAIVLDIFSGTGSLGLEAYSRGAKQVHFVDSHAKSIQVLKKNILDLGIDGDVQVTKLDAFRFLKSASSQVDLVFLDPPFTRKLADSVMQALSESKVLKIGTMVLIESSHHEVIKDQYLPLKLLDRKSFGDKNLSIYQVSS